MLENLTAKSSTVLELITSSPREAELVRDKFEKAKRREAEKESGMSTDFVIRAKDSVVLIEGRSAGYSIFIAQDAGFLSEEKQNELSKDLLRLEKEEKLANALASRKIGVFAQKLTGQPLPKSEQTHQELGPELQNDLAKQRVQVAAFLRTKVQ